MKTISTLFASIVLLVACTQQPQDSGIITVDLTASYPKTELNLSDIADVTYIKLELDEDFLTNEYRPVALTKHDVVLSTGASMQILRFDWNGKPIQKYDHYGNGPHEYLRLGSTIFDEQTQEIYIKDNSRKKVFVYDYNDHFLREFDLDGVGINSFHIFDDKYLIDYKKEDRFLRPMILEINPNRQFEDYYTSFYRIISRKDGKEIKRIIPTHANDEEYDAGLNLMINGQSYIFTSASAPLIPHRNGGMVLNELSSDTIFILMPNLEMKPLFARTPSVADASDKFIYYVGETDQYILLDLLENNLKATDANLVRKNKRLVFNKQDKKLYQYTIKDPDFEGREITFSTYYVRNRYPAGYASATYELSDLQEALEKGKLHGRLKEIAETLTDEDNDVVVIYRLK